MKMIDLILFVTSLLQRVEEDSEPKADSAPASAATKPALITFSGKRVKKSEQSATEVHPAPLSATAAPASHNEDHIHAFAETEQSKTIEVRSSDVAKPKKKKKASSKSTDDIESADAANNDVIASIEQSVDEPKTSSEPISSTEVVVEAGTQDGSAVEKKKKKKKNKHANRYCRSQKAPLHNSHSLRSAEGAGADSTQEGQLSADGQQVLTQLERVLQFDKQAFRREKRQKQRAKLRRKLQVQNLVRQ